jgi:hypothetical protein
MWDLTKSEFEQLLLCCSTRLEARGAKLTVIRSEPATDEQIIELKDLTYPATLPRTYTDFLMLHNGVTLRADGLRKHASNTLEILSIGELVKASYWLQNTLRGLTIQRGDNIGAQQYVTFAYLLSDYGTYRVALGNFAFAVERRSERCPLGELPIVRYDSAETVSEVPEMKWEIVAYSFDDWVRRCLTRAAETDDGFEPEDVSTRP